MNICFVAHLYLHDTEDVGKFEYLTVLSCTGKTCFKCNVTTADS